MHKTLENLKHFNPYLIMNYDLPFVPARDSKPRQNGTTMVIDKGLCLTNSQGLIDSAGEYIDFAKLGFGTALLTPNLGKKLELYRNAGITPYFGGTLFEIFMVRDMFDDFRRFVDKYNMEYVEVSDGSLEIPHDLKLECITKLSNDFMVFSEVGSKVAGVEYSNKAWVQMMQTELAAGATKVIAEARESGSAGIYNKDGSSNNELISELMKNIDMGNIMWEAPKKDQQAMFIKMIGPNVNLGNISTTDVVALEALRVGFRGDTFFDFLPNFGRNILSKDSQNELLTDLHKNI